MGSERNMTFYVSYHRLETGILGRLTYSFGFCSPAFSLSLSSALRKRQVRQELTYVKLIVYHLDPF